VRFYDIKRQNTRPVIDLQFDLTKYPLNNVVISNDGTYLYISDNVGDIYVLDTRKDLQLAGKMKGAMGCIKQMALSPLHPYLASVSLDRYVRIYNTNTNKLFRKIYLKNKLTSVALLDDVFDSTKADEIDEQKLGVVHEKVQKTQNQVKAASTKLNKKAKIAKLKLTFEKK